MKLNYFNKVLTTERSLEFERLVRSALEVMGSDRLNQFFDVAKKYMVHSYEHYGPLAKNYPKNVFALDSLWKRISKYESTHNTEFLVDAFNFCLIEFMRPSGKCTSNNYIKTYSKVSLRKSLESLFDDYRASFNPELLVIAAKLIILEFYIPFYPDAKFVATAAEESPGIVGLSIKEAQRIKDNTY